MKIIRIAGGIGNQLFQYAFYREQLARGNNATVDISWFDNTNRKFYYPLQLRQINFEFHEIRRNRIRLYLPSKVYFALPHYVRDIEFIYRYCFYSSDYVHNASYSFEPQLFESTNDYLHGYWINYKYFENCKDELMNEVCFPDCGEETRQFENKILENESVSIHIRMNDYSFEEFEKDKGDYYYRAIELISNRVNNPHFFVFSNRIDAARKILLRNDVPITYVDMNDRYNGLGDMKLISMCKHNIISASTFSFWAAFFNKNNKKIVIVPRNWNKSTDSGSIVFPEWIKL